MTSKKRPPTLHARLERMVGHAPPKRAARPTGFSHAEQQEIVARLERLVDSSAPAPATRHRRS